jgi:tRNA A-37 threonylcarbamoyl transferase component Bud32
LSCKPPNTTYGIVFPETENLTPSSDVALNIDTPKSINNHLFHRQKLVHSSQATSNIILQRPFHPKTDVAAVDAMTEVGAADLSRLLQSKRNECRSV